MAPRFELYSAMGTIDIGAIDPAAVAALSEPQQLALSVLIDKVQAREAASARYALAVKTMNEAGSEQHASMAQHAEINKPQTVAEARASAIAAYNASL